MEDELEAVKQKWMSEQVELEAKIDFKDDPALSNIRFVGGSDLSFFPDDDRRACASLTVVDVETLEVVYSDLQLVDVQQPYIPGFLAFREVEHLKMLIDHMRITAPQFFPQVFLVDGNGVLHPRGCGIASHLGVICNVPTVGVAKTFFYVDGLDQHKLKEEFRSRLQKGGDTMDLVGTSGRVWGRALRSVSTASNPLFVSVGHRVSLDTATKVVTKVSKYRVPEPIRQADLSSRQVVGKGDKKDGKSEKHAHDGDEHENEGSACV